MTLEFKGTINKCLYNTTEYKIYSMKINSNEFPKVKISKYGTCTITGNFQELEQDLEYNIIAEEVIDKKYGTNYKVRNISLHKPDTRTGAMSFLEAILTYRQATTLLVAYPDIIDRIIKNEPIDLSKTKGIKEATFKIVKKKVIENFVIYSLVQEFKQTLDYPILIKLYEKYNSVEKLKEELQKDPYKCLTQISRIGFIRADEIIKKLDIECTKMINKGEKPPINLGKDFLQSESRCVACIEYILETNQDAGSTKMDLKKLVQQVSTLVPECKDHFKDSISHKEFHVNMNDKSVTLQDIYDKELYIAYKILDGIKQNNIWDCNPEDYRIVNENVKLTDEQLKIVDIVCKNNISILSGISGSGKSTSVIAIINMCKKLHKTFQIVSFSAKAAKVIASYTNEQASTIHRCLGSDGTRFAINQTNKLSCDIVIVDETSMCGVDIFEHLIEAIDFTKTKLLLVGDHNQLAPVSYGNIYYDLIMSHMLPFTYLSKAFRYGTSAIATVGTHMVNSQPYLNNNPIQTIGTDKAYYFINIDKENLHKKVLTLYTHLIKDKGYSPSDIMVLSAMNKNSDGSDILNRELQPIANKKANTSNDYYITNGLNKYYQNDIVMQIVNNYKEIDVDTCNEIPIIPNGETGVVVEANSNYLIIKFDEGTVKYSKDQLSMIKLGYCMSVTKSQGSGSKVVIYITPPSATFMTTSNLMYVAITRAKQFCYHVGSAKTVNLCIKKKDDLSRQTNLLALLVSPPKDIQEQYDIIFDKIAKKCLTQNNVQNENETTF